MTVGDKIRKIRTFRGMTQKELGVAIGLEEKGADNRVAQYETNYRVPKKDLLNKIAEVLRVDRQNFYTDAPGCAEDFMRTFFWLDEDSPGSIRLFQLVRNPVKERNGDDTTAKYNDSDEWPVSQPVECTSNMVLSMSSCRNGCCANRSFMRGRSRERNTLNGN